MIISIASGKGGTGKTTVSTNLSLSLSNVKFLDCDVEEPNANIFLKTHINKNENVTIKIPDIDQLQCDFCESCAEFCQYNALAVVKNNVLVFPELCHSCDGCELVCHKGAIHWIEDTIGIIENVQSPKIQNIIIE